MLPFIPAQMSTEQKDLGDRAMGAGYIKGRPRGTSAVAQVLCSDSGNTGGGGLGFEAAVVEFGKV